MDIYIEIIVLIFVLIVFLVGKSLLNLDRRRALKKYNPEKDMSGEFHKLQNDRTKKGGVFDEGTVRGAGERFDTIIDNSIRPEQSERRELLPTTNVSDVRENSTVPGENSSNFRTRLFGRNSRKK
jgi:hypothetical protein